jgi:hypothetical protein
MVLLRILSYLPPQRYLDLKPELFIIVNSWRYLIELIVGITKLK